MVDDANIVAVVFWIAVLGKVRVVAGAPRAEVAKKTEVKIEDSFIIKRDVGVI